MSAALAYEWRRLATLRSTWWLLGLSVTLSAGIAALITLTVQDETGISEQAYAFVLSSPAAFAPVAPVLLALVGAFCFGHEYRHQTILSTLAAIPRRRDVLLAKTVVTAGVGAVGGLLTALAIAAVTQVLLGGRLAEGVAPWAGEPAEVLIGLVVLCLLFALLGLGLAGLLRALPAALVVLLVLPFVVEPVLVGLLNFVEFLEPISEAAPYLPFTAGNALVLTEEFAAQGAAAGVALLSPLTGGLVLTGYTFVLLTLAGLLFARRDA